MTRDEILNLTPEQLRVEIARRKGYTVGVGRMDRASIYSTKWYQAPNGIRTTVIPDWPNDIAAAWELLEEASDYLISSTSSLDIGRVYSVRIFGRRVDSHISTTNTDTLPVKICRAWLMWRKGEDESI